MKQMIVDAKQLDFFNKWLQVSEIDFDKADFPHDATLFCQTVEFDDGTFADLKVCSGRRTYGARWCGTARMGARLPVLMPVPIDWMANGSTHLRTATTMSRS